MDCIWIIYICLGLYYVLHIHPCLTSPIMNLISCIKASQWAWMSFCPRNSHLHVKPANPAKSCLFTVTSKLEGRGFPIALKLHTTKCSGESAASDVRLLQGERVCSRKTAEVRWLLFLWCRLVTFWWLGSDVVSSAPSCLLSDLEARGDVKSIVFTVNSVV